MTLRDTDRYDIVPSPHGPFLLLVGPRGAREVRFARDDRPLDAPDGVRRDEVGLAAATQAILGLLCGEAAVFPLPLDPKGTAFQRQVWSGLRQVPRGETRTYGELAALIGRAKAARAVGGALNANPLAIVVPCHRIVAGDGGLGGYAYGAPMKLALLRAEGVILGPPAS